MGHSNSLSLDRAGLEPASQSAKRQKLTPPTEQGESGSGSGSSTTTTTTTTNGATAAAAASTDGNMPLRGKVFTITGGASGIGLATAKVLSRRGAAVAIADVDPEAMKGADAYFSGLGVPYSITRVDVSRRAEVDGWIGGVVERFGRLDGAANVAGVIGRSHGTASVAELDDADWDRIIAVNLTGMMYCLRAQLRKVVDGGSIVNTSSIHGLKGKPTDCGWPPKPLSIC